MNLTSLLFLLISITALVERTSSWKGFTPLLVLVNFILPRKDHNLPSLRKLAGKKKKMNQVLN